VIRVWFVTLCIIYNIVWGRVHELARSPTILIYTREKKTAISATCYSLIITNTYAAQFEFHV